jgi:hypothetical protein
MSRIRWIKLPMKTLKWHVLALSIVACSLSALLIGFQAHGSFPKPEPEEIASLLAAIGATLSYMLAILRNRAWLGFGAAVALFVLGLGPVLPWLMGDHSGDSNYDFQGFAFAPLLLFLVARTVAGQLSKAESILWWILTGVAAVVAAILIMFTSTACPQIENTPST